ncbi:MAG: DUF4445 domain-containing protein [Desulfovibrionaceae bacterium]|nr:DUF4445 domain-containing protein [Desulfovibrionaceae bacterium]
MQINWTWRKRSYSRTVLPEDAEAPLSRLLWLAGPLPPRPLCTGLGACGRCLVRFISPPPPAVSKEKTLLDCARLEAGFRLACCHTPESIQAQAQTQRHEARETILLEIAEGGEERGAEGCAEREKQLSLHDFKPECMAFDIGTTSLCWAGARADGSLFFEDSCLNPQAGAGSDVISRLALARDPAMRTLLSECVRKRMRREIPSSVRRLVVCGNTAMTDIFLDRPVDGLCQAPLFLTHQGNEYVYLPGFPKIYIPPLAAPFIGSDVTCGLMVPELVSQRLPWIFIDLGTNAEFALRTEKSLYFASVPMGPAVEGIGMRCGSLAGEGVVTGYKLEAQGLCAIPDGASLGIAATGYFSLLALLVSVGVLDLDGHFKESHPVPLVRKILAHCDHSSGRERLMLPSGLFLDASDIEACLTVKAAFCVAFSLLLSAAALDARDLSCVVLAGALGAHCDPSALRTLGFFPEGAPPCLVLGNTALAGALEIAKHCDRARDLVRLCERAHCLSLTEDPRFAPLSERATSLRSST